MLIPKLASTPARKERECRFLFYLLIGGEQGLKDLMVTT
jgi:hypothetical protein